MFRFFVNKRNGNNFILSNETIKHINVARATHEKFICVFEEKFYICKLENNVAKILSELKENHEYIHDVIIAQSIIDTKRFEWLIQKATELGITKIIPVFSKNVSKKIGDINKKVERWNLIAKNASEQSFRNKQLIVTNPMTFDDVINIDFPNKYIAHEKSNSKIHESFSTNSLFLVGPEGGFTDEEINKSLEKKFEVISFGKRILRSETASIFICSRINE